MGSGDFPRIATQQTLLRSSFTYGLLERKYHHKLPELQLHQIPGPPASFRGVKPLGFRLQNICWLHCWKPLVSVLYAKGLTAVYARRLAICWMGLLYFSCLRLPCDAWQTSREKKQAVSLTHTEKNPHTSGLADCPQVSKWSPYYICLSLCVFFKSLLTYLLISLNLQAVFAVR